MVKPGQRIKPAGERRGRQIGIRLTDEERESLEKISDKEGLPISHFVRQGIRLIIQSYSTKGRQ